MGQDGDRHPRTGAEELVGELWAAEPRGLLETARASAAVVGVPDREPCVAGAPLRALLATLARVLAEAEVRALSAPPAERPALALLAATARSLHQLLAGAPAGSPRHGDARVTDAHLRVARMERWLAERAEHEPGARAAADAALWVLEQLECRPG
jgi:hypothetical protein